MESLRAFEVTDWREVDDSELFWDDFERAWRMFESALAELGVESSDAMDCWQEPELMDARTWKRSLVMVVADLLDESAEEESQ